MRRGRPTRVNILQHLNQFRCLISEKIEPWKSIYLEVTEKRMSDLTSITRAEERYPSGSLMKETWYQNGGKHRDSDLPAEIVYHEDGSMDWQVWYQNDQRHRDADLPASIVYRLNGSIAWQNWYQHGQLHRDSDLPAAITYRGNDSILRQEWYQNGQKHRDSDLPAVISHYQDGSIFLQWHVHGVFQGEATEYPEPSFEDLVKPAFCLREPATILDVQTGSGEIVESPQERPCLLEEE